MGKVIIDITTSLDGFIAGPHITAEQPMGEGGIRLHDWFFGAVRTSQDKQILDDLVARVGAVIVGKRTYTTAIDNAWEGATPFSAPAFVVLSELPATSVEGFTYVKAGIESALIQARSVAGEKAIWIMGGANLIQQYLKSGFVDELHLHIVPVLLGRGTRLFKSTGDVPIEFIRTAVIETPGATHLSFRIAK